MAGPSEGANQEMLTRTSQHKKVKTYTLVKADKPDLRQVRDSEGNLWYMQEKYRSNHTRSGRHHDQANDKATTLRGSQETTREKGRHTMSNQAKPQKYSTSTRRCSPAGIKKGKGDQHLLIFEDTEFEARSCTTPRNAEWAQWAIHATSKTRQSSQQPSSKAEHPGSKNADLKRTKSRAVPKQGEPRQDVAAKGSEDISRRDSHTLPGPISRSEDAAGDTNLGRGSITSLAANHSRQPEDVGSSPQDDTRRNSSALPTKPYSQPREVVIEDESDGDSRGSITPRATDHCLSTVKPLNQHHRCERNNDLKEYAEGTSQVPLQVERALEGSNTTRRSSRRASSESPLRRETGTPTDNGRLVENKSPIPNIDDLRTIPSENESNEFLSRLPEIGRKFDWRSMDFERQRLTPNVRVASWYEHDCNNCDKPLPDLPKEDGSPKILLRRKPESSKTRSVSNHTQVGSRFFETGLM